MESIEMTDVIKDLIKETKGLGEKSAEKLFIEKEADTEEKQLVVIAEFAEGNKSEKLVVNRNGCDYKIDKKNLQGFIDAGWKLK